MSGAGDIICKHDVISILSPMERKTTDKEIPDEELVRLRALNISNNGNFFTDEELARIIAKARPRRSHNVVKMDHKHDVIYFDEQ